MSGAAEKKIEESAPRFLRQAFLYTMDVLQKRHSAPLCFEERDPCVNAQTQIEVAFAFGLRAFDDVSQQEVTGAGGVVMVRTEVEHMKGVVLRAKFRHVERDQLTAWGAGVQD